MWEERNPYHAPTAREGKWCGYCIVRVGFDRWSTEINVDDDIIVPFWNLFKEVIIIRVIRIQGDSDDCKYQIHRCLPDNR